LFATLFRSLRTFLVLCRYVPWIRYEEYDSADELVITINCSHNLKPLTFHIFLVISQIVSMWHPYTRSVEWL
jgi:hypothetical protein